MLCDELKVYVPQDGPYGLEPEEGGKLVEEETCYLKSEADAAIAELKNKLDDAQAKVYADSIDAWKRERRLRRALYKACANWAHAELMWASLLDFKCPEDWDEMERKCRAKAEEYK